MSDKAQAPAGIPRIDTPPTLRERVASLRGSARGNNSMARGLLLFSGLVVFTVLYALLLQWLSAPNTSQQQPQARQPATVQAKREAAAASQAVADRSSRPAGPAATAAHFQRLDDATLGSSAGFTYVGAWQHIRNSYDGRSAGTSSRTYHLGASANFRFSGRRLNVYGVKGPNGGYAELRIDGQTYALLRFYARHKQSGVLIYSDADLPPGAHSGAIIAAEAPNGLPKRRFVNLDGVAFAP